MRRALTLAIVVCSVVGFASCSHRQPRKVVPPPEVVIPPPPAPPPWDLTLDSVRTFVSARQYADADRTLAAVAVAHAGTPEAAESDFWRALLLADPLNADASPREAIASLDAYIARGSGAPRYLEALALKRLVASSDTLRASLTASRLLADQRDKARIDELAKRQLELDSVKTELDRIKRRLTGKRER